MFRVEDKGKLLDKKFVIKFSVYIKKKSFCSVFLNFEIYLSNLLIKYRLIIYMLYKKSMGAQ